MTDLLPPGGHLTAPEPAPIPEPRTRPARFTPALILVLAIFVAYMRVWHCGFIWDDDDHLTRNPCIVGPLGFAAIWTSAKAVYYPLVLTSFWIQHQFWGLNPLPYHVVNVAMHAACALLLWVVLRRLRVAGAWLGAALWALHPVQVESAAWITELKNTQSCFFYLLAILFFIRWRRLPSHSLRSYAAALICAVLAILSKSSTVMLPVVLGLVWWWLEPRWRWRNIAWLVPFLMVSVIASLWTIWEQKYANHALGPEWSQTWPERIVISGKDVWFYLWKLAWPHPLIFIYPRWNTDATHASAFIPLMGVACVAFLLWMSRDGKLRPVFFAFAYFLISLFPVLSFFNVYFFRYSFVGDHFQYLASIGPLALIGASVAVLCNSAGAHQTKAYACISAALITILGSLTWFQCGVYYSLETLWRSTLAGNPDAFLAQYNLADVLVHQGHLDEALVHYRELLRLKPDSTEGLGNLANVLLMQGHVDEAINEYQDLLRIDPNSALAEGNLSTALLSKSRAAEAIEHARKAVQLMSKPDPNGRPQHDAPVLRLLASAYEKAGRYSEAVSTEQIAIQHAVAQPDLVLAETLARELRLYQARAMTAP